MNDNTDDKLMLSEGPIASKLLGFVWPVLGALALQAMYGAVDLLVVGKFGIAADISAVATGAQLMQSVTGLITSLAVGTTVLVGNNIGAGRKDDAGRAIAAGLIIFIFVAIFFTLGLGIFAPQIAGLMQAPPQALERTTLYIRICGIGSLFIVAYNLLGSIFRGIGDSKTPLLSVLIACALNIAGDLYFVKNLNMGAKGAALATILSQAISVAICAIIIFKKGLPFEFNKKSFSDKRTNIKQTLKIGIPAALSDFLAGGSFLILMAIINTIGVVESAGAGVAQKLAILIQLVPLAFMQSLSAFVAQNIGAGKLKRANQSVWLAIGISFGIAIFVTVLAVLRGDLLAKIFTSDPIVIAAAREYLRGYALDALFTSWMFCFVGYFNGRGYTGFVLFQGLSSAFIIRVPLSYYFSKQIPVSLYKIGLATPITTAVQVIMCIIFYLVVYKRERSGKNK